MSFQRIVEYYMLQDLDGDSIERLIGKQPILYEDLKKYKSLSDLCPRNSNFQVILYEELEYSGHYVALIVDYDNRIVNFFDRVSYDFLISKTAVRKAILSFQ